MKLLLLIGHRSAYMVMVTWGLGLLRQRRLTSDEDVGGVGLVAGLGGDAEGVEALVLLVEVREGQRGALPTPVHLVPLGRRQQDVCRPRRQVNTISTNMMTPMG